jgi:hypothetical protein
MPAEKAGYAFQANSWFFENFTYELELKKMHPLKFSLTG